MIVLKVNLQLKDGDFVYPMDTSKTPLSVLVPNNVVKLQLITRIYLNWEME